MEKDVLLRCSKMCKNFGPVRALANVDFEIKRGQICGLIGENGSGKSTLTSIIAGVQAATSGEMYRLGEAYCPANMAQAQNQGIAMVVQETGILPGMSVASNIFVGNLQSFSKHGIVDNKKMNTEANRILDEIGASDIRAEMNCSDLNFEDRKIVEIARAMYLQPEILVIDETTTALAQKGRQLLYRIIQKMEKEHKAVIFISHDLDELVEVCNTITVLRDGILVGHLEGANITVDNMRPMMVGREMMGHYYREDWESNCGKEVVLDVKRITSENGYIRNFSLQLHKGEILGLGGLADCGMHEVMKMIFGYEATVTGEVVHVPSGTKIKSPRDATKQKIAYVSKDRDMESIILNAPIKDNLMAAAMDTVRRGIFVPGKQERETVRNQIEVLSVKCRSGAQYCSQLSGGNKQKVAFGKWLASNSEIFLVDCPTRGIDIGVKAAMYNMLEEFKKQGKAVLMISEELPELIGMSDRMIIMKDGKITAEIMRSKDVRDSQLIEFMI